MIMRLMPDGGDYIGIGIAESIRQQLDPNTLHAVNVGLAREQRKIVRTLERTNIRSVAREACMDFLALGSGTAMPIQTVQGNLSFNYLPANMVMLEDAPNMDYGGCFWYRKMRVRDFRRIAPEGARETGKQDDDECVFVFGFVPSRDGVYSFIFEESGKEFLWLKQHEDGARPVVSANAGVSGGETYGLGEAGLWLPDAQTLNALRRDELRCIALWGMPMFMVAAGATGGKRIPTQPGAQLLLDADSIDSGAPPIMPLQTGGSPGVMNHAINEMRSMIREDMAMMERAGDPTNPPRTATEWTIAHAESKGDLDGLMVDYRKKSLEPLFRQAIEVLREMGEVDYALKVDGRTYTMEIIGESEREKRILNVQHNRALVEFAANFPTEGQVMLKGSEMIREVAEALGKSGMLRSPEEQAGIMAALEAQQGEAQAQ